MKVYLFQTGYVPIEWDSRSDSYVHDFSRGLVPDTIEVFLNKPVINEETDKEGRVIHVGAKPQDVRECMCRAGVRDLFNLAEDEQPKVGEYLTLEVDFV